LGAGLSSAPPLLPSRDRKKGTRNRKILCVTGKYHEQPSETGKDILGTGKLLSQLEKNNMKPKKVFMKPENCYLKLEKNMTHLCTGI